MDRPTGRQPHDGSRQGVNEPNAQKRRRPRRALLNLGMPFAPIDDLLNQSEDVVALGYRVLEDTVKEIKKGYEKATEFNKKRKEGLNPAVEWNELVDRLDGLQKIAMDAVRDGTEIMFDSFRSGTSSLRTMARTFQQSRDDVDARPRLAGPVFYDPIVVKAQAGTRPEEEIRTIRHPGLTRLRIHATVDALRYLTPAGAPPDQAHHGTLTVESVTFEPVPENENDMSRLTVSVGTIADNQIPGVYEGHIVAKNFELLITKLRVIVQPRPGTSDEPGPAPGPSEPSVARRTHTGARGTAKNGRARATNRQAPATSRRRR
jgi:hypothetical protein